MCAGFERQRLGLTTSGCPALHPAHPGPAQHLTGGGAAAYGLSCCQSNMGELDGTWHLLIVPNKQMWWMGEMSEEAVLGSSGCCLLSRTRAGPAALGTAELGRGTENAAGRQAGRLNPILS